MKTFQLTRNLDENVRTQTQNAGVVLMSVLGCKKSPRADLTPSRTLKGQVLVKNTKNLTFATGARDFRPKCSKLMNLPVALWMKASQRPFWQQVGPDRGHGSQRCPSYVLSFGSHSPLLVCLAQMSNLPEARFQVCFFRPVRPRPFEEQRHQCLKWP